MHKGCGESLKGLDLSMNPCRGSVGCADLGRGAEPPQFWGSSIWPEPGFHMLHGCTMMQQCALHVSFARYC